MKTAIEQAKNVKKKEKKKKKKKKKSTITKILAVQYVVNPSTFFFPHEKYSKNIFRISNKKKNTVIENVCSAFSVKNFNPAFEYRQQYDHKGAKQDADVVVNKGSGIGGPILNQRRKL